MGTLGGLSGFLHRKQAHQTWLGSNCGKSLESPGSGDKRSHPSCQHHCSEGGRWEGGGACGALAVRVPVSSEGLCAH